MFKSRKSLPNIKCFMKPFHKNEAFFSVSPKEVKKRLSEVSFGIIRFGSLACIGAIAYANYEPRFKHFLGRNLPYVDHIYELFSDDNVKQSKNDEIYHIDIMHKNVMEDNSGSTYGKLHDTNSKSSERKMDIASYQDDLNKIILKLKKTLGETLTVHRLAANTVQVYEEKLNEAFELSGIEADETVWKEINDARLTKDRMLKFARKKASEVKIMLEALKYNAERLSRLDFPNSLVINAENYATKCLIELQKAAESTAKEGEARNVAEFEKILKVNKELFEKEVECFLPNEVLKDSADDDLNSLITHAYDRIEELQGQIARLQEADRKRNKKQVRDQDALIESVLESEINEHISALNEILGNLFASLKHDFEVELRKLLVRQARVHVDHLAKSLDLQEHDLNQKHRRELEQKLSILKKAFVLETFQNEARVESISEYLKTMQECNKLTQTVQVLWLVCQDIYHKITHEGLSPLAKEVEKIKTIIQEDNDFGYSVLGSIPVEALNRGVYNAEALKKRFEKVKKVCKNVALIDENNDSLYRYFLCCLQSFLRIDAVVPKNEIDVDISKLDTFDILKRTTDFLNEGNLEEALYCASQLKGEPSAVAKDWINELRYLLETQLAFKALLAYAASNIVQAYY